MGEIQLLPKEAAHQDWYGQKWLCHRENSSNFHYRCKKKKKSDPFLSVADKMGWDNTGKEKNSFINIWMVLCSLQSAFTCNDLICSWPWGEMHYVLPQVTSRWPGWTWKLGFFPPAALLLSARSFFCSQNGPPNPHHSDVNVRGFLFTPSPLPAISLSPIVCEILKCRNQVFDLWVSTFWAHSRYFTNVPIRWMHMDTNLQITQVRDRVKLLVNTGACMYWSVSYITL